MARGFDALRGREVRAPANGKDAAGQKQAAGISVFQRDISIGRVHESAAIMPVFAALDTVIRPLMKKSRLSENA